MMKPTLDFLKRLLDTPGPSGFETAPARVWREEVKAFADDVKADVHGNSTAAVNPQGAPRLMLAGHIDEIGLQVTHVDDDGYLYFAGIGGWDPQVLVGQRVVIAGPKGPVRGVIGKQAIHLMKKEDIDKVSKITDLWIDIGAATGEEARGRAQAGSRTGAGPRVLSQSRRIRPARALRRAGTDSLQRAGGAARHQHRRGRDLQRAARNPDRARERAQPVHAQSE